MERESERVRKGEGKFSKKNLHKKNSIGMSTKNFMALLSRVGKKEKVGGTYSNI